MARSKALAVPEIELKIFATTDEIDRAIAKLQRCVKEIEKIDFEAAVVRHSGPSIHRPTRPSRALAGGPADWGQAAMLTVRAKRRD